MKLRQFVIAALAVSATAAIAGGNKSHLSDTSKSKDQTAATSVSGQDGSSMAGTNAAQPGTNAASAQGSDSIRQAQQALNDKGFDAGKADGVFGPHTQSAVMKFQQAQGIQQTGQLDSQTLAALGVQAGSANLSMGSTSGTNAAQPSSSAEAATSQGANAAQPASSATSQGTNAAATSQGSNAATNQGSNSMQSPSTNAVPRSATQ